MFNWLKKLFGKEEKQKQVVDSGRVSIQAGGDVTISTPGSIHLTAKTVEVAASEGERILAAIRARKPVHSTPTVRRNPAPHASAARSPSRSSSDYRRRDDYDTSPNIVDYAVIHAATSSSYDSGSSSCRSSSSSYDSGSSSSSYDSGSSSSDSGSCGGGGD